MRQPIDEMEMMRAQVSQSLVEHAIVAQALRAQAIVSALFILALGSLCFFLWRRHGCLNEAFHLEIRRHSVELSGLHRQQSTTLVAMVKQHSLEHSSTQMQMLHYFEGIVAKRRGSSATSPISSVSTTSLRSTGPIPAPPPLPSRTPKPG